MPFNVALSGIRAANSDLRVTGNNIANASTTGFKQSRTDFGDIYSSSAFSGLNQAGSGVRVQDIAQQFTQGNISFTENALDLSVSGSGFFVTSFGGDQSFTRAGTFGLDQQGFIVNNNDARLQGFGADSSGNISGLIDDIQIQTTNIQPTATTGVDIGLNVDSREAVIQTAGTRYLSSGGVARADVNGYAAQSLSFTNPDGATVTFNSLASDNTFDTVSTLNGLSGVTATSESSATLSTWSNGLNVTINGATITNTGINQTTATDITNLPGLTATYDAGAGTISVVSTIGDLVFGATGSGGADQFLSVTGSSGLPQTLEFDGAGDLVTTGNLGVSGILTAGTALAVVPLTLSSSNTFKGNFTGDTLVQSSSGNFTAAAAAGTLLADLTTAGATDYDFNITVDGTPSAANISVTPGTYADEDAVAAELQAQIDADASLNGLGITVAYDTDHFVFTSSNTTGSASTVAVTAVNVGAGTGLGITSGTATPGTDSLAAPLVQSSSGNFTAAAAAGTLIADLAAAGATDYDFSITVDGTPSAADISVTPGTYADEDAVAAELQTQIDADVNLNGLGITVLYDTDHFVFTSPSTTGSTSTVAVTAVGMSAGTGLGITGGSPTAGTDANAYDFSIAIDGLASAANISLPVANYANYDAMATALQVAVNADVNLSGVTVTYDTDHFVFTSPSDTGVASTVAITAAGANAGTGLGITGGAATAGNDTGTYDFSITVDGVDSTTDISLPIADYASYDDLATALETAINGDTSIEDVSVVFDTDHFVFTSGTTGTTSTVALTAVGASVADLGIGTGTATAGVTDITVGGLITLALDEGYTLTDNSGTPIFINAPVSFVNNGFDPRSPDTYNHSTSVTLYDSLGNAHVMQQYFIKQPYDPANSATFANHWEMAVQIDGENVGDPIISAPTTPTVATFDVFFTPNGTLDPALSDSFLISNWTPIDADGNAIGALGPLNVAAGGSTPVADPAINSNFEINMDDSTQVGSEFEVRSLDQNGSTTGRLVGIDVDDSGIIFARYTNGENEVLAQVALADFSNSQGLQADGDSSWVQTFKSGEPIIGGPGTASLGLIQSGALEDSNVDLSEQLVNLIIAQRNFQANAKTIETADTITQTIINLR
ncbi:MAG: flagellar hook protein FlgE [Candidatus Endobugula sp.]|jgi:flagellar hook protein FlgE